MTAICRYPVSDEDRAVVIYTEVLGCSLVTRMGTAFAVVQCDGVEIWLSGPESLAARTMPDGAQPHPGGWNRFVMVTQDIESEVTRLKESGATLRGDVIRGPGGAQVLVNDCEGNVIEIFQPLRTVSVR